MADAMLRERGNHLPDGQPTLTDEEREAISAAACICEDAGRTDIAVVVNTALERLG
jgi:hypothetical protein